MKRKLIALLALVCLLTLPSCKRTPQSSSTTINTDDVTAEQMEEQFGIPVVRVMIDLPNNRRGSSSNQLSKTLEYLPGYLTDFRIFQETLPTGGPEREMALTRMKTEIMAGNGPDLFLCGQETYGINCCSYGDYMKGEEEVDPFFPFPEKSMKNRIFLPLDGYIENAEYMEWDKLLPIVMEAGKNEEGQQIIPLEYSFAVTIADKEKYGLTGYARPKSREEMAESDNIAMRYASRCRAPHYIGRVMEPAADEPRFTEEELLGYMLDDRKMGKLAVGPEFDEISADETGRQGAIFRGRSMWDSEPFDWAITAPTIA